MWGGFNASIDGEGFFITALSKLGITGGTGGIDPTKFKEQDFDYTRVGQFLLDSNGYVVDASGRFVYGYQATDADPEKFNTVLTPLRIPSVTGEVTGTGDAAKTTYTQKTTLDEDPKNASTSVSVEINNLGIITATVKCEVTNGTAKTMDKKVVTVGKVAIATFQNPNGVSKAGGNYYKATKNDNTGTGVAAAPGDAGTATLMGGFIEASNVDLAKEFADMITTHRGFQANSKMITVSDEMLSDLVAMKR